MPSDFCGYAHYLAPEQVSGQGHGLAVDFWALGTLLYELVTGGANPWLTGDPGKDSEVGIYQRISTHVAGKLAFPDGLSPSSALVELLNDLLIPSPEKRLGARPSSRGGPKEVRQAKWFSGFNWERLEQGKYDTPHKKQCADAISAALKERVKPAGTEQYKGDASLFSGFSSLFSG